MKVARTEFIQNLESVEPGLSPTEAVQQSSCIAFKNKEIFTFNGEVACRNKSLLGKEFTGAVPAKKMLELLRKLTEDEIEIQQEDGKVFIIGQKRKGWLLMENEIHLPIDQIEKPAKWKKLNDDFPEAVDLTQECVGKDDSQSVLMCIHIHPDYVEACDQIQMTRYTVKSGVSRSLLVRREGVKHIVQFGMTEVSETEQWLHFRNPVGMVMSCCTYLEDYPDLSKDLVVKGHAATLPKGLEEAAEKADLFSSENADYNMVTVQLRPGKIRIVGEGVSGGYSEIKALRYEGEAMSFLISPKMLIEILKKHNQCTLSEDRLSVKTDKWTFVTRLGKIEDE